MLGIITALPIEARSFGQRFAVKKIFHLDAQKILFVSGMGKEHAEQAAHHLVEYGAKSLLSFGTAGALAPYLKAGDIIIPNKIITNDETFNLDLRWQEELVYSAYYAGRVFQQALFHTPTIIQNSSCKQKLLQTTGAIAADMETGAIAAIAEQYKIPMACIRVITDPAHFSLPQLAAQALSWDGKLNWRILFKNLTQYPHQWLDILRLAQFFRQSKYSLNQLAKIVA